MFKGWVCLAAFGLLSCELESYSGPSRASAPPPAGGAAQSVAASGCDANTLCFRLLPAAPGALGPLRLVLIWTRPGDGGPQELATLATLSGNESNLAVPLASIPRPVNTIAMGQAWGYLFVVAANDPAPNPKHALGAPNMMLVHAVGAASQVGSAGGKFPNGIAEGTAPYFMQTPPAGHDLFVLAAPGSVFDLRVCPPNAGECDVSFPNPS